MAEQQHKYTGILLLLFSLLVLIGAIFLTIAQTKVTNIPEYKQGNEKLKNAKNNLLIAYVLGYIAVGMGIVLAILYFGHVQWGVGTEIPHLIVFIVLFLLVIISGIFGLIALSNINNSNVPNKNSATNWIWVSMGLGIAGLIMIIISGAWRAAYVSNKKGEDQTQDQDQDETEMTFTAPTTTIDNSLPGSAPAYVAPEAVSVGSPVPLNGSRAMNYVV